LLKVNYLLFSFRRYRYFSAAGIAICHWRRMSLEFPTNRSVQQHIWKHCFIKRFWDLL